MKTNGGAVDAGSFDYIVTGAGSAGCAVAARLSENGRHRVLLLEAGGEDRYFWIHVPVGYSRLFANPRINWMFESEPEPELEGRSMYQPRGKVLGGTSSINGMVYMRGNPADYDLWRQRGCTGWDWDSVLPYFKKAENQERGPDATHGVGGPLRVSDQPIRWELADAFIAAAVEAGLPANNDFNDGEQEGAGPFQTTTNRKRRWSTARAYLTGDGARILRSAPTRMRRASRSKTGGRAASSSYATASRIWRARKAKLSSAAVSTVRRSSCNCPGSDPRRCCNATAFRWSAICPRSGPICRTISMCG
jgi:choline dehydrogenase